MFKRLNITYIASILALLFVANVAFAQDNVTKKEASENIVEQNRPKFEAKLLLDSILIGDQTKLQLNIDKDVAQVIVLPEFTTKSLEGHIEVLGEPTLDTLSFDGRDVSLRVEYTITSFERGVYDLQRFPLLYVDKNVTDTIYSDSLKLFVDSFEIDTATYVLHDIKPTLNTPITADEVLYHTKELLRSPYTYLALLILALIIFGTWWFITHKGKKEENKPVIPPHVVAILALEELNNKKLWQNGKQKQYYTGLSDILRSYLDNRYGINAMEMTSEEIFEELEKFDIAIKEFTRVQEVLKLSDFVKFAKFVPSVEENEKSYNDVYYFVEETKQIVLDETQNEDALLKADTLAAPTAPKEVEKELTEEEKAEKEMLKYMGINEPKEEER